MGILDAPALSKSQADGLYVPKQTGKGLSANDYSDTEKATVSLLGSQAVNQLIPCTGRLAMPQQNFYSAVSPTITYRSVHLVTRPTTYVQFMFVNQSQTGIATNSFTLTASVQGIPTSGSNIASIQLYKLTFSASLSVVVPAGGVVFSDPIWLPMKPTAGAFFLVKSGCSSSASSNNWPVGMILSGGYNGQGAGDQTASVGWTPGGVGGPTGYAPSLILTPNIGLRFSLHGVGDSILDGSNDQTTNRGFFGMFIENNLLSGNRAAVPGEQLNSIVATGMNYRHIFAKYATHTLCEYGTNDIFSGLLSLATMQANLISYWYNFYALGQKVMQTTILPRTTSADNWQIATNQSTLTGESVRIALNEWLRAGAPCTVSGYTVTPVAVGTLGAVPCLYLYKVLDICSVLEVNSANVLTQNGGRWLVGGTIRTGTATSATATSLADASANFSSLPVPGAMVRIASGTGAGQVNWIVGASSATNINLLNSWTTTPDATSTYTILDTPTRDGTHPSTNYHTLISNYLTTQLPTF